MSGAGLIGLFISAFVSSSLLPGGSEAILLLMASSGSYSLISLLIVATLGNTLGGMSSWIIGYYSAVWINKRYSQSASWQRAMQRVQRYGAPVLFFSWLPVIGDPLCVAAGYARCNPWASALFILIGKCARYAVLLWLGKTISL